MAANKEDLNEGFNESIAKRNLQRRAAWGSPVGESQEEFATAMADSMVQKNDATRVATKQPIETEEKEPEMRMMKRRIDRIEPKEEMRPMRMMRTVSKIEPKPQPIKEKTKGLDVKPVDAGQKYTESLAEMAKRQIMRQQKQK